jgi:hypothetical protein
VKNALEKEMQQNPPAAPVKGDVSILKMMLGKTGELR